MFGVDKLAEEETACLVRVCLKDMLRGAYCVTRNAIDIERCVYAFVARGWAVWAVQPASSRLSVLPADTCWYEWVATADSSPALAAEQRARILCHWLPKA